MTARPSYGSRRPYAVPEALADLHGPVAGLVELPSTVAWTGRRTYDLEVPADLVVMYERVIVEASTVEVLDSLIDGGMLLSVWVQLYLPQHVRQLWQSRFPQLASAA
jgi:hypothetical protein